MQIFAKAAEVSGKVLSKVKVNSPTGLVIGGTVLLVGAVIAAHEAGRKVEGVIFVNKEQIDNLKEIKEAGSYENEAGEVVEFDDKDYKRELALSYGQYAWDMTKLYGPVVILAGASAACYIGGHKVMAKRLAGATALYLATEEAFGQYRENVVKVFDKDTDEKLYYGLTDIAVEEYRDTKIDEKTGEEVEFGKTKKREVAVLPSDGLVPGASQYAVWLDECKGATSSTQYTQMWLDNVEAMANGMLANSAIGIVHMIDIYDTLGVVYTLNKTKLLMAHETGWVRGEGDNMIKFYVRRIRTTKVNPVTGENVPCIRLLLDFNCPGSIRKQLG